ncbi:DUF6597 domain-containing transcriptional factor [Nonomuraea sp. NPDC002799]
MYAERPPGPDLAARVACVWHQVSEAGTAQLVVPDACVDLIWGPGGVFVAGPDTRPMTTPMVAGDIFAGIRFRPGGAGDVFGVPLQELRDQRIPLADLPAAELTVARLPAGAIRAPEQALGNIRAAEELRAAGGGIRASGDVEDAIRASPDVESVIGARLHIMCTAVQARLARSGGADPAAPAIAAALRRGRTVAEVAWDLGLSERQLHRRSLVSFGYAPKTLQRIVRFQRALRLARAGERLADVAATAGYTDQAHLAHDVKRLSGMPMRDLVSPVRQLA